MPRGFKNTQPPVANSMEVIWTYLKENGQLSLDAIAEGVKIERQLVSMMAGKMVQRRMLFMSMLPVLQKDGSEITEKHFRTPSSMGKFKKLPLTDKAQAEKDARAAEKAAKLAEITATDDRPGLAVATVSKAAPVPPPNQPPPVFLTRVQGVPAELAARPNIDSMSAREARALYDELRKVFEPALNV